MYVEINGRQTGKTKRLITDAKMWLSKKRDNVVVLCCPSEVMANDTRKKILEEYTADIFQREELKFRIIITTGRAFDPLPDQLIGTNYKVMDDRIRFYWDEFDICRQDSVEIVKNGFYVTTPKFVRKPMDVFEWWSGQRRDNLLSLKYLAEKQGKTVHKHWALDYPKEKREMMLYGKAISDDSISLGQIEKELNKWA